MSGSAPIFGDASVRWLRVLVLAALVICAGAARSEFADGSNTTTCEFVPNSLEIVCGNVTYEPVKNDLLKPGSPLVWPGVERFLSGDQIDRLQFLEYVAICVVLVLLAGMFSGLTLGLLSLDPTTLKVLMMGGKPQEQKYAKRIAPLVARHHLLLVTLLLSNATVMETLPLFLDKLVPTVFAIIISVTAVLFFGEVIPQAVCSRHGLAIGAHLAYVVAGLMIILLPISWPISKLLDCLLGHDEGGYYRRSELAALVDVHRNTTQENEDPLTENETKILKGVLVMREKTIGQIMTSLDNVYMLPQGAVLNDDTMTEILSEGHSRVPIFVNDKKDAEHFFLVKTLIKIDPGDNVSLADIRKRRLLRLKASMPTFEVLDIFQTGKAHIAGVVDDNNQLLGVVTLEDIIEELIQEEIVDETDRYEDVERQVVVNRALRQHSVDTDKSPPVRGRRTRRLSAMSQATLSSTDTMVMTTTRHVDDYHDNSGDEGDGPLQQRPVTIKVSGSAVIKTQPTEKTRLLSPPSATDHRFSSVA